MNNTLPGGLINAILSPVTGRLFDKFGPRGLVIPGFAIIVFMLFGLSNVSTTTAGIFVILMHIFLFVGVTMVMMAAQTNDLNQLPRDLYPDGNALMATIQQVAGAIGTSVWITIMTNKQNSLLTDAANQADPSVIAKALTAGAQDAFMFGFIIAIIALICSLFIKTSREQNSKTAQSSKISTAQTSTIEK